MGIEARIVCISWLMACPGATEEGNCDLATHRLEVFIWVGMVDVKRKQPGLRK